MVASPKSSASTLSKWVLRFLPTTRALPFSTRTRVLLQRQPKIRQALRGTGDAFASLLLGLPDNAGRRNVLETEHGGWVNGVYFQDEFKVNSRLTINLGIRWDVTLWPIYGKLPAPDAYVGDLDLSNGTYILANVPGPCTATQGFPCIPGGVLPEHVKVTTYGNHAIYSNDYSNVQGRAGLAYRITDKTAFRAGLRPIL